MRIDSEEERQKCYYCNKRPSIQINIADIESQTGLHEKQWIGVTKWYVCLDHLLIFKNVMEPSD